jgi:hypothetical protein
LWRKPGFIADWLLLLDCHCWLLLLVVAMHTQATRQKPRTAPGLPCHVQMPRPNTTSKYLFRKPPCSIIWLSKGLQGNPALSKTIYGCLAPPCRRDSSRQSIRNNVTHTTNAGTSRMMWTRQCSSVRRPAAIRECECLESSKRQPLHGKVVTWLLKPYIHAYFSR